MIWSCLLCNFKNFSDNYISFYMNVKLYFDNMQNARTIILDCIVLSYGNLKLKIAISVFLLCLLSKLVSPL